MMGGEGSATIMYDKQMRVFGNNIKPYNQIISNDTEINLYDFTFFQNN